MSISSLLSLEKVKVSHSQEKLKISNKASSSNWIGRNVVLGLALSIGVSLIALSVLSGFGVIALGIPLMVEIPMLVVGSLMIRVALYNFLIKKNTSEIGQEKPTNILKQEKSVLKISQEKPRNIPQIIQKKSSNSLKQEKPAPTISKEKPRSNIQKSEKLNKELSPEMQEIQKKLNKIISDEEGLDSFEKTALKNEIGLFYLPYIEKVKEVTKKCGKLDELEKADKKDSEEYKNILNDLEIDLATLDDNHQKLQESLCVIKGFGLKMTNKEELNSVLPNVLDPYTSLKNKGIIT